MNVAPSSKLSADSPGRLRVLVVDDNRDAADTLAEVAAHMGCEARACYGGREALDAVRAAPADVLLLDLDMPGMGGLELAERLRALAGPRPQLLVATTGRGEWEDQTATALAGFHYHLVKPVEAPDLRAAFERFRKLYRSRG